jgi:aminoglycoside 6'-N-acetyltransferase I
MLGARTDRSPGKDLPVTPIARPALNIRLLTDDDLPVVTALYAAVFNGPPWHDAWTPESAAARVHDAVRTPGALGLVAWQDGRLAGCLLGYREQWYDGVHFYLKELFVDPVRQRHGIGTHLLQELRRHLERDQVSRIYLLTERDSAGAAFYSGQGFSQSPRMTMLVARLNPADARPESD